MSEQILERVILSQELKLLLSSPVIPLKTKQLCHNFLHYPNVEKAQHLQGACMFGAPKEVSMVLPAQRESCLELDMNHVPRVQEHFRFFYWGTIFHSRQYERCCKSDSSFLESEDSKFFTIKRIFGVIDESSLSNGDILLLCRKVVREESELCMPGLIMSCFFSLQYPLVAVKLSFVAKPCILMSFSDQKIVERPTSLNGTNS